jgi:orotate phosphoribosyltransferase-like protein
MLFNNENNERIDKELYMYQPQKKTRKRRNQEEGEIGGGFGKGVSKAHILVLQPLPFNMRKLLL